MSEIEISGKRGVGVIKYYEKELYIKLFEDVDAGNACMDMVQLGIPITKADVDEAQERTQHLPFNRQLLDKYGYEYDGFLLCYTKNIYSWMHIPITNTLINQIKQEIAEIVEA
ncbi:MAG: hypothetical protein ACUVT9_05405 [Candidatus Bathycorpusculaceae bacterium]